MAVEGFLVFILAGLSHIRNIDNRPAPVNRMKLFLCLQSEHNFVLKVILFFNFFLFLFRLLTLMVTCMVPRPPSSL